MNNMLNSGVKLNTKIFDADVEMEATRDRVGKGFIEAGKGDANVVVLSADLKDSTKAGVFEKEFPERFIEMGVAEQNMATVAAGMANYGKVPFITSYAAFSPGRNYEQIRTTIALNNVPVKICGMHAGVSVGPDGATHQMLEDVALMRALPNMIVINPCDAEEGRKAVVAAATNGKPTYLRFGREKTPVMTAADTPFEIGTAYYLWKSTAPAVVIIGTGALLYEALKAAQALEKEGISVSVLNSHTIKPLDKEAILAAAKEARAVVTVEEHQMSGGLGGAVAEFLGENFPTPIEMVAVRDLFGQSGTPEELAHHYGLDAAAIVAAAKKVYSRKQ